MIVKKNGNGQQSVKQRSYVCSFGLNDQNLEGEALYLVNPLWRSTTFHYDQNILDHRSNS
jgi:hypothetical protein